MSLVEANPYRLQETFGFGLLGRSHSKIEPLASRADTAARLWVRSMDHAFVAETSTETPPIWLYERFRWGPHAWPVRWCDVPTMERHDCGLMAALSTEILQWRGWRAFPAQFVLYFNDVSTRGWSNLWKSAQVPDDWCAGNFAYHEGTAVLGHDGQMRFWDPLGRFWLPIPNCYSYEGIVALRFNTQGTVSPLARCAERQLLPNRWYCPSFVSEDPTRLMVDVRSGG